MKAIVTALLSGVIFGVGLCVSGMTDPKNILAFLDVAGKWSPNLAGVMLSAVAVHAAWLRWGARGGAAAADTLPPARARIDGALLGGSALFGVGWGLSGYCPGPSIVALGTGRVAPLVFVAAMIAGMLVNHVLVGGSARREPVAFIRRNLPQG